MSSIKNVVVAGASGSLGSQILEKLTTAGDFVVTVLRRNGSTATFPEGTRVIDVDFTSVDSLISALAGQDAVVSALGNTQIAEQLPLIDAAFAAGVKRLIPSEFGCNLDNPQTRQVPVFAPKVQLQDHIKNKSKDSPTSYTFVYNVAFLDWGLEKDFILNIKEHKATIFGTGDVVFSTTTLASVADAVVGVLRKPEETKNRAVLIEDAKLTQNKLLALAKKANPEASWEVTNASLDDIVAKSDARLAQGLYDSETFIPYLYKALYDPALSSAHEKTDNELLGLKGKSEDEVFEVVKKYVR
ncbi:hypothetical protein S40285_03970 [Stachybotrys chlorohalonatus IBT 40285]|uniref:NmrA-like domain-containing protein n=1 Tax=Stachybotrys chlorohalonatus (strain IBT 40285) TaxID=1283841 RepID=A0A084QKY3_STAC4|nr:hypothetical protein S40285_03970 [Stachybotrys chlorohalonata IBT 40285]